MRLALICALLISVAGCDMDRTQSRTEAGFNSWWLKLDHAERQRIMSTDYTGTREDYAVELNYSRQPEPEGKRFVAWWNRQDPAAIEAYIRYTNLEKLRFTSRGGISKETLAGYASSSATIRPLKLTVTEIEQ